MKQLHKVAKDYISNHSQISIKVETVEDIARSYPVPYLLASGLYDNSDPRYFDFERHTIPIDEPIKLDVDGRRVLMRHLSDKGDIFHISNEIGFNEFRDYHGLEIRGGINHAKTCKRVSRIMRPFPVYDVVNQDDFVMRIDTENEGDIAWDGWALMDVDFAQSVINSGKWQQHHTGKQAQKLSKKYLKHTRWQITIMTPQGQVKAHVRLEEGLGCDLLTTSQNIKTEIKQCNERIFVGLEPYKGKTHANIDIQSLCNLGAFLNHDHMIDTMTAETEQVIADIESLQAVPPDVMRTGEHDADMRQNLIDTLLLKSNSALNMFLMSGGDVKSFPYIYKMAHRARLDYMKNELAKKLHLPGFQRWYVATDANFDYEVESGHYHIDIANHSLVVNAQDWRDTLQERWGGGDMDDAVLVYEFLDHDGEQRGVIWRQPNQSGEYALLRPLNKIDRELPKSDSRELPLVVEEQTSAEPINEHVRGIETDYTPNTLGFTKKLIAKNKGILGRYCNLLMIFASRYNRLPKDMPINLEDVIDATVKTGAQLQYADGRHHLSEYIEDKGEWILKNMHVPETIKARVYGLLSQQLKKRYRRNNLPVKIYTNHWLDTLFERVDTHIQEFETRIKTCTVRATVPSAVLEYPVERGKFLHQVYESAEKDTAKWLQRHYGKILDAKAIRILAAQYAHTMLLDQEPNADDMMSYLSYCWNNRLTARGAWKFISNRNNDVRDVNAPDAITTWKHGTSFLTIAGLIAKGHMYTDERVYMLDLKYAWANWEYRKMPVEKRPARPIATIAHLKNKAMCDLGNVLHKFRGFVLDGDQAKFVFSSMPFGFLGKGVNFERTGVRVRKMEMLNDGTVRALLSPA